MSSVICLFLVKSCHYIISLLGDVKTNVFIILKTLAKLKCVFVSGDKKYLFFRKIWGALFSCYLRFEIRSFALLPTNLWQEKDNFIISLIATKTFCTFKNVLADWSDEHCWMIRRNLNPINTTYKRVKFVH